MRAMPTFFPRILAQARDRWASISFFVLEAAAAFVMTVIVLLLLMFRRSELREVRGSQWKVSGDAGWE